MLKGRKGGNRKSRRKGPGNNDKLKGAGSSKEVAKKDTVQCKPCSVILTDILKERPELRRLIMSTDTRAASSMEGASGSFSTHQNRPMKKQVAKKSTSKPAGWQSRHGTTTATREPPKKTPRLEISPGSSSPKENTPDVLNKGGSGTPDGINRSGSTSESSDKQAFGTSSNHSKLPTVAKKSTHSIKRKTAERDLQQNGGKPSSQAANSFTPKSVGSSASSSPAQSAAPQIAKTTTSSNISNTSAAETKSQSSHGAVNGQKSLKCSSLRSIRVFAENAEDISIAKEPVAVDRATPVESNKLSTDPEPPSSVNSASPPLHVKASSSDRAEVTPKQSAATNGKTSAFPKEVTKSNAKHEDAGNVTRMTSEAGKTTKSGTAVKPSSESMSRKSTPVVPPQASETKSRKSTPAVPPQASERKSTPSVPPQTSETMSRKSMPAIPPKTSESMSRKSTPPAPRQASESMSKKSTPAVPAQASESTSRKLTPAVPTQASDSMSRKLTPAVPTQASESMSRKSTPSPPPGNTISVKDVVPKKPSASATTGGDAVNQKPSDDASKQVPKKVEQQASDQHPKLGSQVSISSNVSIPEKPTEPKQASVVAQEKPAPKQEASPPTDQVPTPAKQMPSTVDHVPMPTNQVVSTNPAATENQGLSSTQQVSNPAKPVMASTNQVPVPVGQITPSANEDTANSKHVAATTWSVPGPEKPWTPSFHQPSPTQQLYPPEWQMDISLSQVTVESNDAFPVQVVAATDNHVSPQPNQSLAPTSQASVTVAQALATAHQVSLVEKQVITSVNQARDSPPQVMASANQVSATASQHSGSGKPVPQSVKDANSMAVSAALQSAPAKAEITVASKVSNTKDQASSASGSQQMPARPSSSPATLMPVETKKLPKSSETYSSVPGKPVIPSANQPSVPLQNKLTTNRPASAPSSVNQTPASGNKVPVSASKEPSSQIKQYQSNAVKTSTKGTGDPYASRSPPPLIPVQTTSLPLPSTKAKSINKTAAANNSTGATSKPGAVDNDVVLVEDTSAAVSKEVSNSRGKSPPNQSLASSAHSVPADEVASNPPKSKTPPAPKSTAPPASDTSNADSDKQELKATTKPDAEPVAIVIDDSTSVHEDQPSVQQDQGLPSGTKRQGEPNPGLSAKKPKLDNSVPQASVSPTVATNAADSSSILSARHLPASIPVLRPPGNSTSCAAQHQEQALEKEEFKKIVEDKVTHCMAKAYSQMKQFQDKVAKLTKVCKGWEEYARKLQQKLVTMNREQDRLKKELKKRGALGRGRLVDIGVQVDQQQPNAPVSTRRSSGGSTVPSTPVPAPKPAAENSAPRCPPAQLQPNTTSPQPSDKPQPAIVSLHDCVSQVPSSAQRQQAVPKPPQPAYTQPPPVQRVAVANEAVNMQVTQPANTNVTSIHPPVQARKTVRDVIQSQPAPRTGPQQPQVATAPKAPPAPPASQPQTVTSQRTTPTGAPNPPQNIPTLVHHPPPPQPPPARSTRPSPPIYNNIVNTQPTFHQPTQATPTRQKTPEKARVPSQDPAKVNAVIDLTEDAEETPRNSQVSSQARKPSGAGPPPLLRAVFEPPAAPNTVAPTAQAQMQVVRPFTNSQPTSTAASVNSSTRNFSEVVSAIVNSTRAIQPPLNMRTVTTTVQQISQNSLHTLPSTAPTFQRPPHQVLAQVPQSSVGYVAQPVAPPLQTAAYRPPPVTTAAYAGQPAHVVESYLNPPVSSMRPPHPGNPMYNHYLQPQRHPVPNIVVQTRHHLPPTMPGYRPVQQQTFHQVQPPNSMMQAPRPVGPSAVNRPIPPPLLHSTNPPQVQPMKPPMQPSYPPRPPPLQQPPQQPPINHPHPSCSQHPAPLPPPPPHPPQLPPQYANLPLPHKTTLHIAKAGNGIVLSWNVTEAPNPHCPTVDCYQLFAYQEGTGPPNTNLWKKIGDVKALPLPMACTLTQFLPGSTYHFAVRAMDVYGRVGPFSAPCSIDLSTS